MFHLIFCLLNLSHFWSFIFLNLCLVILLVTSCVRPDWKSVILHPIDSDPESHHWVWRESRQKKPTHRNRGWENKLKKRKKIPRHNWFISTCFFAQTNANFLQALVRQIPFCFTQGWAFIMTTSCLQELGRLVSRHLTLLWSPFFLWHYHWKHAVTYVLIFLILCVCAFANMCVCVPRHPGQQGRASTSSVLLVLKTGRSFTTTIRMALLSMTHGQHAAYNQCQPVPKVSGYSNGLINFLACPPSFLVVTLVMIPFHHFQHTFFEIARNHKIQRTWYLPPCDFHLCPRFGNPRLSRPRTTSKTIMRNNPLGIMVS